MGAALTGPELNEGESVAQEVTLKGGDHLVHDGNSRWVIDGDTAYFIVNADYVAPEDD